MLYEPNKWMVSGETDKGLSKRGYEFLRSSHGLYSGEIIGQILYMHFVAGFTSQEVNRMFKTVPQQNVKGILSGTYSPNAFMEIVEHEPKTLEQLFNQNRGDELDA